MQPSIVIGARPKQHDHEPIELGLMVSRLTNAPIDVVGSFWFDTTPQRTAFDEYRRLLNDEVRHSLEQTSGGETAPGEIRVHVTTGSAAQALHEKASDVGAGLIVVGSTHRGAVGRITLSTTADRVLDRAPCPVAIAPRGFRDEGSTPQGVGVAFVDTEGGRAAMRAGAAIARCAGASLIAYTVVEPHAQGSDRDHAQEAVERAIADHASDVAAEARMLTEGGVESLVAESRHLDVLVRGCRSRGPVRPPLAFGLPSKLAHRATCPLVIVPPGREEPLLALFGARAGAGHQAGIA